MKSFGSINISNSYIEKIINNYSVSDTKDDEEDNIGQENEPDYKEAKEDKLVTTDNQPCVQAGNSCDSKLVRLFVIKKNKALILTNWLHVKIDPLEDPRDKLLYIRSLCEAGYFPRLIKLSEYSEEFGPMPSSSYYDWMGTSLNYSREEIDGIIGNLPFH